MGGPVGDPYCDLTGETRTEPHGQITQTVDIEPPGREPRRRTLNLPGQITQTVAIEPPGRNDFTSRNLVPLRATE